MSSNQVQNSLYSTIQSHIENYIENISTKFNLDKGELLALWNGTEFKPGKTLCKVDTDDLSLERLSKANKAELVALCKAKGHKCTGTKETLLNRLLGREETNEPVVEVKKAKGTVEAKNRVIKKVPSEAPVIKTLMSKKPEVVIRQNNHGNYEHPPTRLVFHKETKKVLGKQQDDGTISELTDEDIENCKKFKFTYDTPTNLDLNNDQATQISKPVLNREEDSDVDDDVDDAENVEESDEEVELDED